MLYQIFDSGDGFRVGRLAQHAEQRFHFAHGCHREKLSACDERRPPSQRGRGTVSAFEFTAGNDAILQIK